MLLEKLLFAAVLLSLYWGKVSVSHRQSPIVSQVQNAAWGADVTYRLLEKLLFAAVLLSLYWGKVGAVVC
jgi:hypothetical protein